MLKQSIGIQLISRERNRQITEEGCDESHDKKHPNGELVDYAIYLLTGDKSYFPPQWDPEWMKFDKHSREKRLIQAGGLIAAELDRLHAEKEECMALAYKTIKDFNVPPNTQGTILCPRCGGNLHYKINPNNHIWGKCETEGCLSWLE